MTDEIRASVAALPASGGVVYFYSWDRAEHDEHMAALRSAAFRRGLRVTSWGNNHSHCDATLVPRGNEPVRCCSGQRGGGRKKARRNRTRYAVWMQAYAYRDRIAKVIGWDAAVKDPTFNALLKLQWRGRRK